MLVHKPLTPIQGAILERVNRLGRVKLDVLQRFFVLYAHSRKIVIENIDAEFNLAVDLLVLYGAVHQDVTSTGYRILVAVQPDPVEPVLSQPAPSETVANPFCTPSVQAALNEIRARMKAVGWTPRPPQAPTP